MVLQLVGGNSLIGNDFYESHLDLDDATLYKINCFDWNSKFRDIMKTGGFDVVIGNPPYVQIQGMEKELKEGYKEANYKNYEPYGDIYQLFFEKSLNILNNNGIIGLISSNKWMQASYGAVTRDYFYNNAYINQIVDLGSGRFKGATVDTSIIIYSKNDCEIKINEPREFKAFKFKYDLSELKNIKFNNEKIIAYKDKQWIIMNNLENSIFEKFNKYKPLKDWSININRGITTGFNGAFIIDEETKNNLIKEDAKSAELIKPILRGRDIQRYSSINTNTYIIVAKYGSNKYLKSDYPAIYNHLCKYEKELKNRGQCKYSRGSKTEGQHHWLELDNNPKEEYLNKFEETKIVWKRVGSIIRFSYIESGVYLLDSNCLISSTDKKLLLYLLSILNSKLVIYYLLQKSPKTGTGDAIISVQALEPLPIPKADDNTQSQIISLVENIIDLNKKLSSEKNPNTIEMLNTRIQAVDAAIDKIVYALYNLTDDEIRVIEGE
ncbi:Eco57I restriction-modification methylase domain-containing protein [Brachyspira pilosicoli]|uniref:Eco57I restriction-modification methylase domain-containing protein n=1 Tax=Brachyspira pilosicoli TaxID=52584 RepID=UPI00300722E7